MQTETDTTAGSAPSTAQRDAMLPVEVHLVTAADSPEYALLQRSLARSSVLGFDAEWKPSSHRDDRTSGIGDGGSSGEATSTSKSSPSFPTVTLLQIACREAPDPAGGSAAGDPGPRVFLVDLLSVPLTAVWEMLREVFESPHVLKLGFRFKQDFVYLSSTFASQGCHPGFHKVEPFIDITSVYHYLTNSNTGKKPPKETKSLATICKEVLGIVISKELQCSDWSRRPLTKAQTSYAAADAYYLLEIFNVFECNFNGQGCSLKNGVEWYSFREIRGLKELFQKSAVHDNIASIKYCRASDMVKSSIYTLLKNPFAMASTSLPSYTGTLPLETSLSEIVTKHGERILLKESDRKPRMSKRKGRRQSSVSWKWKDQSVAINDWQGPPPWDPSVGGDECPRFLCDVMVEGLAKYLRCVGIDAAIPSSKRPEPRQLIEQAYKEKRVLLTRDAKLLKHQYLISNQVYQVKSLIKNDQLLEVLETFELKISEEQLMSRCTKCNGHFIQKPLSIEEAIAASKGFQVIPDCLFNQDLEFWQCIDCNQLYWEGTQYQNAVQRFINVCKLGE